MADLRLQLQHSKTSETSLDLDKMRIEVSRGCVCSPMNYIKVLSVSLSVIKCWFHRSDSFSQAWVSSKNWGIPGNYCKLSTFRVFFFLVASAPQQVLTAVSLLAGCPPYTLARSAVTEVAPGRPSLTARAGGDTRRLPGPGWAAREACEAMRRGIQQSGAEACLRVSE